MVAPTPVSALLHAVAVVKMGVFCILRLVFHVMGVDLMDKLGLGVATAYLVSFTIITASIYALTRDDLKARLAYSTISQLSYCLSVQVDRVTESTSRANFFLLFTGNRYGYLSGRMQMNIYSFTF